MTEKSKYELERICFAAPTKWLKKVVTDIRKAGYHVTTTTGMIVAHIDGPDSDVVFRAIEVNHGYWYAQGAKGMFTVVKE